MRKNQAADENFRAEILIAKCSVPLVYRRRNKLFWARRRRRRSFRRAHIIRLRKIAAFANDRGGLCRTRNTGRSARKRGCEHRCGELGSTYLPPDCRASVSDAGHEDGVSQKRPTKLCPRLGMQL